MAAKSFNPNVFLPLKPLDFQILTLLADGKHHGYAIVRGTEREFPDQPALDIGSLYRIIERLLKHRLIEEVDPPRDSPEDRRVRRYYAATDRGIQVVHAEARRMRSLLAAPATRKMLQATP